MKCPQEGKVFAEVKPSIIKSLPIPVVNSAQQLPFINLVDIMLSKNKELFEHKFMFIRLLQSKWPGLNLTGKLSEWPSLTFDGFIKELEKQKIIISLQDQSEWLQFLNDKKRIAESIQFEITQTDSAIDTMVYKLCQVNKEEEGILENPI